MLKISSWWLKLPLEDWIRLERETLCGKLALTIGVGWGEIVNLLTGTGTCSLLHVLIILVCFGTIICWMFVGFWILIWDPARFIICFCWELPLVVGIICNVLAPFTVNVLLLDTGRFVYVVTTFIAWALLLARA